MDPKGLSGSGAGGKLGGNISDEVENKRDSKVSCRDCPSSLDHEGLSGSGADGKIDENISEKVVQKKL